AFFVFLQSFYYILSNFNRIEVDGFLVEFLVDKSFELYAKSEYSHFDSIFVENFIRFYDPVENGFSEVVIRRHERKFGSVQLRVKTVDSVVEIVIAHGCQIVLHHRHQLQFERTTVIIEIRSSLENIAGIEE